ncbi:MAG: ABC transporter permease [Pyrinomonadaceae bacterium]
MFRIGTHSTLEVGGIEQVREQVRDLRVGAAMESLWQDLRYGARMLRKNPGFTLVAVMTLALGISVNTALFTVFDAFALRPLPLRDPAGLVQIYGRDERNTRQPLFSYPDYQDYRARNTAFSDLVAWNKVALPLGDSAPHDDASVLANDTSYAPFQIVSDNYFSMLGAGMTLGRAFLPEENRTPNTHPVIVLSHWFWERRLNSDPNVLGQTLKLQGDSFTIIGVAERNFIGTTPDAPAGWIPLMMRDRLLPAGAWNHKRWLTDREADSFSLLGRLKPGVTRAQAQAEMTLLAGQLAASYPGEGRKTTATLESGMTFINITPELWPVVMPLLLAVGLVLLIACANVANLLLARAATRQKEIGVRLALGATRARLIRQLLTESLLLSALGGAVGLVLAVWTLSALYPLVMSALPIPLGLKESFTLKLDPDYRIYAFTLLASFTAGIVAGLAPALRASKTDLISVLKDDGSMLSHRLRLSGLRNALVVLQIAVCLMLLVGAGLLVRNVRKVQSLDTGLETKNVVAVAVSLSQSAGDRGNERDVRRLLGEKLRALPGVTNVSQSYKQPLTGGGGQTPITLAGHDAPTDHPLTANYNFVSADYFATLGLTITRGRAFTQQEADSGLPVVVISESTARRFWPGEDAIGKRVGIEAATINSEKETGPAHGASAVFPIYEVVGVARDTRSGWVWQKDETYLYMPLQPTNLLGTYLLVRTQSDSQAFINSVRHEAEALGNVRVSVRRVEDALEFQMAPFRAIALLAGVLGLLALALAAIGLYGVMSFVVSQRTREIGIRIALGAEPRDVIRLFLRQGARLILLGLGCGIAGSMVVSRLLASALVDLSPLDPLAFGSVSIFLTVVALLACFIPARRATKVDPMDALRYE